MSPHSPIPTREPCPTLWPCATFPSLLTGKEINIWIPVLLVLLLVSALRIVVSCARCLRRRSRGAAARSVYDDAADAASDIDDGLPRYSDSIGFGSDVPIATRTGSPPRLVARAHDDPYVAGVASLLSLGAQSQTAHTHTPAPPSDMPVSHHAPPRPVANATDVQKLIAELRAINEEPAGVERAARAREVQRRLTALVLADPRYALALGAPPGPPPAYSYSDTVPTGARP